MAAHQNPPQPIVYDVNVFVNAALSDPDRLLEWPVLPSRGDVPDADCIGVINDAREFSLYVSEHILSNVEKVLHSKFGWDPEDAMDYTDLIVEIASESGGGYVDRTVSSEYCKDEEDRNILSLASDVGAVAIVSEDADLTELSPWKGRPILRSHEFADRVAAMRRTGPRIGPPSTTDRIKAEPTAPTLSERIAYLAEKSGATAAASGPDY